MLKTKYEQIVHVNDVATGRFRHPSDVISLALQEDVRPASGDSERILLIGIDWQNDFVLPDISAVAAGEPYGALSVPGAKWDILRLTRFIYENLGKITRIMLSFDTHYPNQIFHRAMWRGQDGLPVSPLTMIGPANIYSHKFRFVGGDCNKAMDCVSSLEKAGKGGVLIWPEHCIVGTPGWNLETQLVQMITFHSAARNVDPITVFKGTDRYSEMYGFLEPEYNPDGIFTKAALDAIVSYNPVTGEIQGLKWDKIIITGEAASHCVPESTWQLLKRLRWHPEVAQRIYLLRDCTSPVAGYEQQAEDTFAELKRRGVNVLTSTEMTALLAV